MSRPRSLAIFRIAAAMAIGLVVPMTARAAGLWTLLGSPLTAQAGVPTTFTLTATNGDPFNTIGCIEVSTGSSFEVGATAVTNGRPWTIDVTDSHSKVTARSLTSGGALTLAQSLIFTVQATPQGTGTFNWSATAYKAIDCGGSPLTGVQLVVIVVTGVAPTPSPTPSPVPTTVPTPTVMPTASAAPTAPPTFAATATPSSTPTADPAASGRPSPAPTSTADPAPGGSPGSSATVGAESSVRSNPAATEGPDRSNPVTPPIGVGAGSGPGAAPGDVFSISSANVTVSPDLGSTNIGASALLLLSVPAILFSVPGLLLVLVFLAQLTGGLLWIPVVRRHLTSQPAPRRARFSRRTDRA